MKKLLFFKQDLCPPCDAAIGGSQIAAEHLGASWVVYNISYPEGRVVFEQYAAGIANTVPFMVFTIDDAPIWTANKGLPSKQIIEEVNAATGADAIADDNLFGGNDNDTADDDNADEDEVWYDFFGWNDSDTTDDTPKEGNVNILPYVAIGVGVILLLGFVVWIVKQ